LTAEDLVGGGASDSLVAEERDRAGHRLVEPRPESVALAGVPDQSSIDAFIDEGAVRRPRPPRRTGVVAVAWTISTGSVIWSK
jgi:hypothetical protein